MAKKIIIWIGILFLTFLHVGFAKADDYTTLRDIDKSTFNEYRYYMVREYFRLKEYFELKGMVSVPVAQSILSYAKTGYNYLPDSLINANYYNDLKIAIEKGMANPNSEVYYEDIVKKIDTYIQQVNIQKLTGNIDATPISGNAPLTVTFRGRVTDPSGTIIPASSYIWWFDDGGVKKVVGRGQSINYTFKEEGNFSMFLDVKSNHKNKAGYTDVLPFSTRSVIEVKEKIASVIINVNSVNLKEADSIKFTPEEANYGLIFDATNSTPTGGAKFRRTEWNFGNGVERKYDGSPKIERVVYSKEGDYTVSLKLTTNEGKSIERKFIVAIHKPIATIQSSKEEGYIGDRFTFSARSTISEKNLSFVWNIIDISNDKVITTTNGNLLTYAFAEKGRYNVQLQVKDAAGNQDTDTKIIYINSRAPTAQFVQTIPDTSKPNRVLLDGTKSYDPDYSDEGKLKYVWTINGEIVELDNLDSRGALGYYTFDSIGDHSVVLEVIDPDNMSGTQQQKVKIESILSVDFFPLPRVVQRGATVRFSVTSPNARYFEWDFGDGQQKQAATDSMSYQYEKSGIFTVKLTVKDIDGKSNQITKTVYVSESNSPYAVINMDFGTTEIPSFDDSVCNGGAYVVDRVKLIYFKGGESINVSGTNDGLSYTWKIGNDKYLTSQDTSYKFTELGCVPIKLTVKSNKNGATHSADTWVYVQNLKPSLASINLSVQDVNSDPVLVTATAVNPIDTDGVIQSYLWYYYTDTDTEPQDFRMTSVPNTTFVIPKITGNYYVVVVMRDDNDARFSSEENTENKFFVSLTGDNVNTPLVDFKVNKSSLYIGEEAIFTAKVKNVLGQDITEKSEFAWDFDGDGFYDQETTSSEISYKYEKSGTFYTKVRVKYKGMTNVRTLEIDVANILEPNFQYIAIGNTLVLFNTSGGKYTKTSWDMGDGNIVDDKENFVYTYEDGQNQHDVTLKISEGTKVKTKVITVNRDFKEMISAKNAESIYVLSNQDIKDGKVTLSQEGQKFVVYIGKKNDAQNYVVDADILIDSDLNGEKDDDQDNKTTPSFTDAGMVEILLNDQKTQTVRVYTLDASGKLLDSVDIDIVKEYIEDTTIDLSTMAFTGVTENEKVKIEQLKTYIQDLPQEHRLKGMKYVQRLQEEWFYPNEKTKIILEFESFIDGLGVTNSADIITLLESFLVEGQEDTSVKNMAYNVVKNLIPQTLVEYNEIIANLDQIKENPDKLEENKVLGREILEMISATSLITNEDKVTIKTQLQVFIYGSVQNIPEDVVENVTEDNTSSLGKIWGLVSGVANILGILLGGVLLIIIGFFVWYKTTNKNSNQGLQDFIIEKTSGQSPDVGENKLAEQKEPEVAPITRASNTPKKDISSKDVPPVISEKKEDVKDFTSNKGVSVGTGNKSSDTNAIPDWLQGAMTGSVSQNKIEQKNIEGDTSKLGAQESPFVSEGEKPSASKVKVIPDMSENIIKEDVGSGVKSGKKQEYESVKQEKVVPEETVPAWLQGALGNDEGKEPAKETPTSKVVEEEVPAWLQGALGNDEGKEPVKETPTSKVVEEEVPSWLQGALGNENTGGQSVSTQQEKEVDMNFDFEMNPDELIVPVDKKKKLSNTGSSTKKKEKKNDENNTGTPDKLWEQDSVVPSWLEGNNSDKKDDDFWTLDTDESNQTPKK